MTRILGRAASLVAGAAILAVIVLMLLPVGSGETDQPDPSPAPSASFTPDVTPSGEPETSPEPETPPSASQSPYTLTTHELPYNIGAHLSITVPDELFNYEQSDLGDQFFYKPANDPLTSISIVVNVGDAANVAPVYLSYVLPNLISESDPVTKSVGNVENATYVKVNNATQYAEAWIFDVNEYYIAVMIGYTTEEQRALFQEIIDTIVLTEAQVVSR